MNKRIVNVMPPGEHARMAAQLKKHEGFCLSAYLDTEGVLTVGYGHNCRAWPVNGIQKAGDVLSEAQADMLFANDLDLAEAQTCHALPWIGSLACPRRAVLVNMSFNMGLGSASSGKGLLGFKRMLAAVERGDFASAAKEMLDSRWARQVGPRSRELAAQMESGEWPPYLRGGSNAKTAA